MYITSEFRKAADIDKRLEEFIEKFPNEDLKKAIIDLYIIQKEKRLGIYQYQVEKYPYTAFHSEEDKKKSDKKIFSGLCAKYDKDFM